jgi:pimeloyl-ACP methyl ester carboxylesterase
MQRAIILCDGMPSIPRKQPLAAFLAGRGYWVFYPRYRGAWESGGEFLERSPHLDILDVIGGLSKEFRELAFGRRFRVAVDELFVIGGSFGGAASILSALDPRVKKAVANCPVVDWAILRRAEKMETSNASYAAYIRAAFGNGYRLSDKNWAKLGGGKFYNPVYHAREITASKVMMFHAQDDPHIPYQSVRKFARLTGVRLKLLRRGGHLSTDLIVRKYWPQIRTFFES